MAADSKPSVDKPDSPQLAHHRFHEKRLGEKLKQLDAAPEAQGFDKAAALARAESQLAEHRKAIKDLTK